jgi:hypothetical protein
MRLYLVEFDNDMQYEDRENFTVGVFETFRTAEIYCLGKGYEKTDTEGYYKKKDKFWNNHIIV